MLAVALISMSILGKEKLPCESRCDNDHFSFFNRTILATRVGYRIGLRKSTSYSFLRFCLNMHLEHRPKVPASCLTDIVSSLMLTDA